jgi:hypothetical protein
MERLAFHLLDFTIPAGVFCQISPDENTYSPSLIIFSLLILTSVVILTKYYYWKTGLNKSNRQGYRIKSAKLIKNGRKYWRKKQNI